MKRSVLVLGLGLLLACSSEDTLSGTPETPSTGDGGTETLCEETAFNPASCTTVSGKTYSFIQNTGGGNTFNVRGGSTMELSLNAGSASVVCAAGSTCDVVMNGGSVSLTCAATAKCKLSCNGGTGTYSCVTAGDCEVGISGGQCVAR